MQSPSYISTIKNQLENAGFDQQLVFHFGEMNYDLLHRMVFSVEDALLALGDDKKVVKNVFSVVTEGLKNTLIHGEKLNEKQDTLFLLATNKAKIKLVIGNYTNSKKQGEISDFIDQLNALEKDQIQKMVQQKLTEGLMEPSINSGIGMLTMRLKSSDQIHYSFTPVNDEVMFLAIQADFNRK